MKTGPQLKVSSDRLVKPKIEPATPGLKGKRFIHYTTAAQPVKYFTDPSKAIFFFGSLCVFFLSCICHAFVRVCLFVPCGHLLEKG